MTDPALRPAMPHDERQVEQPEASERSDGRGQFAALYRAHFGFTWAVLLRLGVSRASVEDAAQELWVTAHRRLAQLRGERLARSWLYGIARRVASHHRRAEQRHRRKLEAFGFADRLSHESPRESALIVQDALGSLDESLREAFVLSELEGWTAPEIAEATGANPNTVYWRVRTAKRELRSRLSCDGVADPERVDAAMGELRRRTTAPRGAAQHCWLVLAPKLAAPSVSTALLAGLSQVKLGIVSAVVAATATVAVLPGRPLAAAATTNAATPLVAGSLRDTAEPVTLAPSRSVPALRAVEVVPTSVFVPEAATPSRAAVPRALGMSQPRIPAARGTEAAVPAQPRDSDRIDPAEAALLARARGALARGDASGAQVAIREHTQRFPQSGLADVRRLLDVESRCALNDRHGAQRIAGDAIGADTAIGARLAKTCVGDQP